MAKAAVVVLLEGVAWIGVKEDTDHLFGQDPWTSTYLENFQRNLLPPSESTLQRLGMNGCCGLLARHQTDSNSGFSWLSTFCKDTACSDTGTVKQNDT